MRPIIEQLVSDALETNLMPILKANISGEGEGSVAEQSGTAGGASPGPGATAGGATPPLEGARQAPDGEWYILDPTRRTRYLRIGPLAQERASPETARVGS
jgi:hypothetical protein